MKVKCPLCKKITEYSAANPYRPFCSERCQILDLGAWADEKYAVPVTTQNEEEAADVGDMDGVNENSEGENASEDDLSPKHLLN